MKRSLMTRLLDFVFCTPPDELVVLQAVNDRLGALLADNKKTSI